MLDKGQIKDWDGEPETKGEAAKPAPEKPASNVDLTDAILSAREAIPTGERVQLTVEEVAARKKRNRWIALALAAFVILVFVLTMAKVGGGAGLPEVYRQP